MFERPAPRGGSNLFLRRCAAASAETRGMRKPSSSRGRSTAPSGEVRRPLRSPVVRGRATRAERWYEATGTTHGVSAGRGRGAKRHGLAEPVISFSWNTLSTRPYTYTTDDPSQLPALLQSSARRKWPHLVEGQLGQDIVLGHVIDASPSRREGCLNAPVRAWEGWRLGSREPKSGIVVHDVVARVCG